MDDNTEYPFFNQSGNFLTLESERLYIYLAILRLWISISLTYLSFFLSYLLVKNSFINYVAVC